MSDSSEPGKTLDSDEKNSAEKFSLNQESCEVDFESSQNSTDDTMSASESSCSSSGRISPTLFLPEARVRLPLTQEQKQQQLQAKNTSKKKEKRKLKLEEMDPEDLMLRASEKGRFDLVEYSLNKNGNIHGCHDEDFYTPLHRASYSGHVDIVKFLIDRGANIRAKTIDGWEPLHSACRWGEVGVVAILLENGADINAITNGRQTPLHLAALGVGGSETLQLLLSYSTLDQSITNNQGETASDVAKRCGKWLELFDK